MSTQGAGETGGTPGTLVRVFGECRHHQRGHFLRHSFYDERWWRRLAVHLQHFSLIATEGCLAGEQAIGDHTETVDIRTRVGSLAATLLRRHVEWRSQNGS